MIQLVSMSIFSFCFVTTVPSWVNEKRPDVDARRVVWIATCESAMRNPLISMQQGPHPHAHARSVTSVALYLAVGLLGAWAMPDLRSDNVLNDIVERKPPFIVHACTFTYTLTSVVPSIPLLAIMIRYNLEVSTPSAVACPTNSTSLTT